MPAPRRKGKPRSAKKGPGKGKAPQRGFLRRASGWLAWRVACVAVVLSLLAGGWFLWDMPGAEDIKPLEARPSVVVEAHDGTVVARFGGIKGDVVDVRDLPRHVTAAVLAIEDRRFYRHFGLDLLGLARAMAVNVRAGRWAQGGSTITQQLAKNLFLTPDKTLRRKVQEAILAVHLDHRFDKDDILSAYLNRVYFGAGAYGIDAAAQVYFNKPATQLTLWEGAVLAGVLRAPSRLSPVSNPEAAANRARVVIRAMHDAGYLDAAGLESALRQNRKVTVAGTDAGDLRRYFADYVVDRLPGIVGETGRDLVVRTTFDPSFQRAAEEGLRAILPSVDRADKGAPQAALVTLGEDGAILAMIGGRDYRRSQFNRAASAMRQPGSAFKPFVYLAALEAGYAADDPLEDAPIIEGNYRPANHDGVYHGKVTLTDALALSMNTATVRLLSGIGLPALLDVIDRLPFHQSFRPELALGLGVGETTLVDLAAAYAVVANGGHAVQPYAVLEVREASGRVIYRRSPPLQEQVFAAKDIRALDGMLTQVVARGTGQQAQLRRGHVAGKTGTSQDYRDAWFVGYTDDLVTGVWFGNDDAAPMDRVGGGGAPARWWRAYMNKAIDLPLPPFVETYASASSGVFGFGGGAKWFSTSRRAAPAEDTPFSGLLRYWTSEEGEDAPPATERRRGSLRPDDSAPQYNR